MVGSADTDKWHWRGCISGRGHTGSVSLAQAKRASLAWRKRGWAFSNSVLSHTRVSKHTANLRLISTVYYSWRAEM